MEVTECFTCECNGRAYPNKIALQAHRRTKTHKQWESENEVFELRCRCKRLENENETLRYALETLKSLSSVKTKTNERPKTPAARVRVASPAPQVS
jgi:hypothetical protein